ncbi:hypothetical protein Nepgr_017410 [Nepenthes gracilis]|uniref:Uncharacterized protein n=1 Tax=Nepenthes gracilis TaxID=150966 RepID=A0AAD3XT25_NEPGR|nr:hypothetical protein Nepgr_017410 [Nepenthes gracilis]
MCVEVGRGDPLPPKIRLLTSATEFALTVEVEVIYHSKPAHSSSGSLYSQKHVANRLPMARASGVKRMGADLPIVLAPVNARGASPSVGVLDEVNLASPVGVKPPVPAHDAVYVLADSVLGYNNAPAGDVGGSTGSLESSDGAHHVLNSSSCSLDHSDGSLVGLLFINVNDTSRGAHQPPLSTALSAGQEPCNLASINQFVEPPAEAVSHENCLIPGVAEDDCLGVCSYSADSELPDLEAWVVKLRLEDAAGMGLCCSCQGDFQHWCSDADASDLIVFEARSILKLLSAAELVLKEDEAGSSMALPLLLLLI